MNFRISSALVAMSCLIAMTAQGADVRKVKATPTSIDPGTIRGAVAFIDGDSRVSVNAYMTAGEPTLMNGTGLTLTIDPHYHAYPSFTFVTGINVRTIDQMKLDASRNQLLVEATEDVLIYPDEIVGKPVVFQVQYHVTPQGIVADEIQIVRHRPQR